MGVFCLLAWLLDCLDCLISIACCFLILFDFLWFVLNCIFRYLCCVCVVSCALTFVCIGLRCFINVGLDCLWLFVVYLGMLVVCRCLFWSLVVCVVGLLVFAICFALIVLLVIGLFVG